jgi:hypothetical protein
MTLGELGAFAYGVVVGWLIALIVTPYSKLSWCPVVFVSALCFGCAFIDWFYNGFYGLGLFVLGLASGMSGVAIVRGLQRRA